MPTLKRSQCCSWCELAINIQQVTVGFHQQLDSHQDINSNGVTDEFTEIKCDNESYRSKQCHGQHFHHHGKCAAVTQQGSWVGGGGAILVTTNFFNFTVNFLGNYWCFWWTFYDTGSPPARRCTCSAARGWGSSSHFWHQFPPPISGPCHHRWPLWRSLHSLASEASCTLSAPLGRRWVDWTMTSLCVRVCVCVHVCVWVWGISLGKYTAVEFFMPWISKRPKLSGRSVKMCVDDIYDV